MNANSMTIRLSPLSLSRQLQGGRGREKEKRLDYLLDVVSYFFCVCLFLLCDVVHIQNI